MAGKKSDRIRESDLLQNVRDTCAVLRLLAYHTHASIHSPSGFPDLVILGPGGILFRELKSATGIVSAAQEMWLRALKAAGMDAEVWRPEDLASQRIIRELRVVAAKPEKEVEQ